MSISDGQPVNAAASNAAFMSKTADTGTSGVLEVTNAAAASGTAVTNVQKELNSQSSFSGKSLNSAKDDVPTWASDGIGTPGDPIKTRVDAVQAVVAGNLSDVDTLQTLSGVGGDPDLGSFTGVTLSDDLTIKGAIQELETAFESGGGGSGGGGINHIDNGHAEFDTDGWVTYDDDVTAVPVDGTGGSPSTLTFSRITTGTLRGDGSFTLQKSPADGQGEGISYDFEVDYADYVPSTRLFLSFDYFAQAAGYTSDDVILFVYNTATFSFVQLYGDNVSGFGINLKSTTTTQRFLASFFTDFDDGDYRLIFHVATTNATSYVVEFDNVRIAPDQVIPGAVITDWQSFTPTGSWSTNTTYTGQWRRVGGDAEIQIAINTAGAPTSASLTIDFPTFAPIDTSKLVSAASDVRSFITLDGAARDTGAAGYAAHAQYTGSTTSFGVVTYAGTGGGVISSVSQAVPFTFGAGDGIQLTVKYPVAGWSPGALFSTTETLFKSAKLWAEGDAASAAGDAPIIFPTLRYQTAGSYSVSTGLYTAPATGHYHIHGFISSAAAGGIGLRAYVSGVNIATIGITDAGGEAVFTGTVAVTAGQTISISPSSTLDITSGNLFIEFIPDFSVFSVYGQYELKNTTSDTFAVSTAGYASAEYAQMTNNSLILSPGTWELTGAIQYTQNGGTATQIVGQYSLGNGNNTTSAPTIISADTPVLQSSAFYGLGATDFILPMQTAIITVSESTTVYLVTRLLFSSAGSDFMRVAMSARRLR